MEPNSPERKIENLERKLDKWSRITANGVAIFTSAVLLLYSLEKGTNRYDSAISCVAAGILVVSSLNLGIGYLTNRLR